MQRRLLTLALAGAGLLAACGGGGGSDSASGGTPTSPTSTSASVTLTGVASKGLMAGANVAVHPIKSDGSVDTSTVLASGTTDSSGNYNLTFTGTKDQPYVVRVSAKSDGSTTHRDEVSGATQSLPSGFVMRGLVTPTNSGTVTTSASITPFSEMAVSAAEGATGGVTAANASQATSTVTQLLGFNPTSVTAKTVAAASTSDEQKLAVLLTAVSELANTGALGCSTGTAGDKTKCVVDTLADSATTTSIKLSTTNGSTTTDVSAALAAAVTTVLTDSTLSGSVASTTLSTVVANLGCSTSGATGTTSCSAGGSTTTSAAATAIASAKLIFTQIKSDLLTLFSRSDASTLGGVNVEANQFKAAMQDITVPAEVMAKDAGALLMGLVLYDDYKNGLTTVPRRGRGYDLVASNNLNTDSVGSYYTTVGCTLYQDANTTIEATAPSNAAYIGCRAGYYVTHSTGSPYTRSEWRHGFTITVPSSGNAFTYSSRARQSDYTCTGASCTRLTNVALQTNAYSGTLTPTWDSSTHTLTAVTFTGDIPGAFKPGSTTLANDHHSWNLTGTLTTAADGLTSTSLTSLSSLSGTLVAYSDASTVAGTLNLKTGKVGFSDLVINGSSAPTTLDLDLAWTTAGAEFEGRVALGSPVLSKTGLDLILSNGTLSGALRTITSGVTTEFLSGTLTGTVTGYGNYDGALAASASNTYTQNASFVGKVSASSRPTLEVTVGTSKQYHQSTPNSGTFQYRSFASGSSTPKLVIAGSITDNGSSTTVSLNEATSTVGISWNTAASSSTKVTYGSGTEIGSVDNATRLLTFTDGSSMSLDLGL